MEERAKIALGSTEALFRAALEGYGWRASPQAAVRLFVLLAAGSQAIQVIVEIQRHQARINVGFLDGGETRIQLADVAVPIASLDA